MIKFKEFFDHVDEYCFVQGNSNVKHFNCDKMKELDKNFSNVLQGPLVLYELDRFIGEFDVRLTCDPIGIVRDTASRGVTDFLLANNRDNHRHSRCRFITCKANDGRQDGCLAIR